MTKPVVSALLAVLLSSLITGCDTLSGFMPTTLSEKNRENSDKGLPALQQAIAVRTLWQANTGQGNGDYLRIHPHLTPEAVIVAGAAQVSAWNKQTGALLWKTPVEEAISGGVNGDDEQVFVGSHEGSVIALNSKTGAINWVRRIGTEVLALSNADQGLVIARTSNGSLVALSATQGDIQWQKRPNSRPLSIRGAGVPLLTQGIIITGTDNGTVNAFAAETGQALWESVLSVPRGANELEQITDIDGRIKIVGSALFAHGYEGQLAGINLENGQVGWSRRFSSDAGLDANPQGLYAVDTLGDLWRFEPETGKPIWKMDDFRGRGIGTPTLFGSQYVMVTDDEGYLHWINIDNGAIRARVRADTKGYSVPPLIEADRVYSFGKGGMLAAHSVQ